MMVPHVTSNGTTGMPALLGLGVQQARLGPKTWAAHHSMDGVASAIAVAAKCTDDREKLPDMFPPSPVGLDDDDVALSNTGPQGAWLLVLGTEDSENEQGHVPQTIAVIQASGKTYVIGQYRPLLQPVLAERPIAEAKRVLTNEVSDPVGAWISKDYREAGSTHLHPRLLRLSQCEVNASRLRFSRDAQLSGLPQGLAFVMNAVSVGRLPDSLDLSCKIVATALAKPSLRAPPRLSVGPQARKYWHFRSEKGAGINTIVEALTAGVAAGAPRMTRRRAGWLPSREELGEADVEDFVGASRQETAEDTRSSEATLQKLAEEVAEAERRLTDAAQQADFSAGIDEKLNMARDAVSAAETSSFTALRRVKVGCFAFDSKDVRELECLAARVDQVRVLLKKLRGRASKHSERHQEAQPQHPAEAMLNKVTEESHGPQGPTSPASRLPAAAAGTGCGSCVAAPSASSGPASAPIAPPLSSTFCGGQGDEGVRGSGSVGVDVLEPDPRPTRCRPIPEELSPSLFGPTASKGPSPTSSSPLVAEAAGGEASTRSSSPTQPTSAEAAAGVPIAGRMLVEDEVEARFGGPDAHFAPSPCASIRSVVGGSFASGTSEEAVLEQPGPPAEAQEEQDPAAAAPTVSLMRRVSSGLLVDDGVRAPVAAGAGAAAGAGGAGGGRGGGNYQPKLLENVVARGSREAALMANARQLRLDNYNNRIKNKMTTVFESD